MPQARRPGDRERNERTGHGDEQFVACPFDLTLDLRDSAEQEDDDASHRLAQREAHGGVPEFVGEDRQREQDREAERDDGGHRMANAVDQVIDDAVVGDRDQRRDKYPGRREVQRDAAKASDVEQTPRDRTGRVIHAHLRDATARRTASRVSVYGQ